MHLAFVTSLVADGRPTTGFEIANEAIIAGLRAIGCKVTVIGFRQPRQQEITDPDTIVLDIMSVENASATFMQKALWMVGALVQGLPVGGSKLRRVSWSRIEMELDRIGPIDGIVINSVQIPTAFPQLLDQTPFIYVAHNVEYRSARQSAKSAKAAKERYFYGRDARLLEPIERKLCQKAAHVFVLSEDDRETLALGEDRATLLPLVLPELEPPDRQIEPAHDVGLIGTWSWQPNLVGLTWFLDEVVPKLDSEIKIAIAGSAPDNLRLENPRVTFLGRVASAEEFVAQSRVLALVSRSGTGVQLKTIEAFQSGMPCVATLSSVRGIPTIPENCRVEDSGLGFAAGLNELVNGHHNGDIVRLDGTDFAVAQRSRLHNALRRGLSGAKFHRVDCS